MSLRNYLSMAIVLIITVFVSWALYFYNNPQQDTVFVRDFPKTIGLWTSVNLPIDKPDLAILETKNAFLRRYSEGPQKSVYLYIVYSQSNPKATNPLEVFYKESGISILDKGKNYIIITPSHLPIKTNWLLLDNDQNQQIAYYWFKVGDIYTRSYWKQQILSALNNLNGNRRGSALIRISADVIDGHQEQAHKFITEFASKIGPQLSQYLP
jgi:EpsI family protein